MADSKTAKPETPATHILDFNYDDENACALTARINHVRFHIIVEPARLKSKSGGNDIYDEYIARLEALRRKDQGDEYVSVEAAEKKVEKTSKSDGGDSGVDVQEDGAKSRSPTQDSGVKTDDKHDGVQDHQGHQNTKADDHDMSLQNWILSAFADEVARLAPNKQHSHPSLHDWYNTPAAFFEVSIKDNELTPKEVKETENLRKRLDDLQPSLPMPKYIRSLPDLPWVDPKNINVLDSGTHDPASPIHPTLVSARLPDAKADQEFFFKAVDPTQPSPTKREITLLHKIQSLGLAKEINVPRLHALVSSHHNPAHTTTTSTKISIMGLLLTPIPTPLTPLTAYLTPSPLSASQRQKYADECRRIITLLHSHNIVFGDTKADNFLVDKDGKLWIIDFGGSYTEGWIDEEKGETREGDLQGLRRIVGGLRGKDEVEGDEDEENEEVAGGAAENSQVGEGMDVDGERFQNGAGIHGVRGRRKRDTGEQGQRHGGDVKKTKHT